MYHMNITEHKQIQDLWPMKSGLSKAINVPYNVTRKWSDRNSIPPEYWVSVVNACHDIDAPVTYKGLAECVDRNKKRLSTTAD